MLHLANCISIAKQSEAYNEPTAINELFLMLQIRTKGSWYDIKFYFEDVTNMLGVTESNEQKYINEFELYKYLTDITTPDETGLRAKTFKVFVLDYLSNIKENIHDSFTFNEKILKTHESNRIISDSWQDFAAKHNLTAKEFLNLRNICDWVYIDIATLTNEKIASFSKISNR